VMTKGCAANCPLGKIAPLLGDNERELRARATLNLR